MQDLQATLNGHNAHSVVVFFSDRSVIETWRSQTMSSLRTVTDEQRYVVVPTIVMMQNSVLLPGDVKIYSQRVAFRLSGILR